MCQLLKLVGKAQRVALVPDLKRCDLAFALQLLVEGLGAFVALQVLANRGSRDPMEVVENPGQKALLAEALLAETEPPAAETVIDAIVSQQRRKIEAELRNMRAQIQEAERRGDFTELALLTQKKLELDRALRQLRASGQAGN